MKKQVVVFVALFSLTGINCDNSCTENTKRCNEDADCCSLKCGLNFFPLSRICKDPSDGPFHWIYTTFPIKDALNSVCAYTKSADKAAANRRFQRYGLNAAHNTLPLETRVQVTVNDKTAIVTINNQQNSAQGAVMELSEEAAKVLDINKEGTVNCMIYVPYYENSVILKFFYFIMPYATLFLIFLKYWR